MNRRMRPDHGFCLIMKRMRNMIGLVLFSMALLGGLAWYLSPLLFGRFGGVLAGGEIVFGPI